MSTVFTSCFASRLHDYVAFRHTLGVRSTTLPNILRQFDRHAATVGHAGPLTLSLVTDFVCANDHSSAQTKGHNYQVVRHFADYLCAYEPGTERLPAKLFQRPRRSFVPYIFSDDEIARLVVAARKVSARSPLRGQTLHAMIGLTVCTGLRISEVCRLDREDVDLEQATLHIRNTKFGKSRRLPLHPTTVKVLADYTAARDRHFGAIDCPAFFLTLWRTRFAKLTLHQAFRQACELAGICLWHGPGPRFHDLRHTFAVHRLASWYREGVSVQTMLPALATYMGHGHYTDTAWYLTATAELLGLAADAFDRYWEQEVRS
jgi:integrase